MKNRNLLLCCFAILFCSCLVNAQSEENSERSKNNIHFEASSWGIVNSISVNFEREIVSANSGNVKMYGRVGYGLVDLTDVWSDCGARATGGFLGLTMLTGRGSHHFEANGGAFIGTFEFKNNDDCNNDPKVPFILDLGYRYQEPEGGLILRGKVGILGIGIGIGSAF